MKVKKRFLLIMLIICALNISDTIVFGNDEQTIQNIPFIVSAKLPENQINQKVSYFDLAMEAKQEQTLEVTVENISDQAIDLEATLYQGRTNRIGVIEYDKSVKGLANGAKVNIEDITELSEKTIKLEPKQAHNLKVTLKMPDIDLSGIAIGAIRLVQKGVKSQEGNIQNNFAREIGVVLQFSDPLLLESTLHFLDVKPEQVNARNALVTSIQNNKPKLIRLANLEVSITKKDQEDILYQSKQGEGTIAPNTVLDYTTSLEGKEFIPGTYVATFEADEGEHHWILQKEFTIEEATSKQLNASDIMLKSEKNSGNNYQLILFIGNIILLVLLFLVIFLRKEKRKKENLDDR